MDFRSRNIGFFDSGIGGISLLSRAIKLLENETFIYYGDSKNAPYGSKSKDSIINLCINICDLLIYENKCKAIVIACNTASSAAISYLRNKYEPKIPIVGIEPAIKPAIKFIKNNNKKGYVLVLATPFTINGEKLKNLLKFYKYDVIKCVSLKDLAIMIEEDIKEDEIYNYLYLNLKEHIGNVDCVVLGCTHYYFVQEIIKEVLGFNIQIFDGCDGTSRELKRRLIENNIENNTFSGENRILIYNSLGQEKIDRCYELLNKEM